MNGRTLVIVPFAVLCWLTGFGQQSEITWRTESIKDLRNNEEQSFTCEFRIYHGDRIDWVQGESQEQFNIISTEGALPEEGFGSVTYHITKDGVTGTITIERSASNDVSLVLDLSQGTSLGAYYRFQVFNP